MVRSLNMLGYELSELYRGTYKVTDSIDIRLFKTWVQQARAVLVKQRLDDNMMIIDEHLVQDLGKVTMAPIDSSVGTKTSDRYMMRSILRLPATINRKGNIGTFTRIASADLLELKFNLVSYERALVSGNGKFNQNDIYTFVHDGYLFIISKTNIHKYIKELHVKGIFANPEDAYTFNTSHAGVPWTDDMEYPVSESIVMDLQNIIMDKKFKFIMTPFEDNRANGHDDIVNPGVKK